MVFKLSFGSLLLAGSMALLPANKDHTSHFAAARLHGRGKGGRNTGFKLTGTVQGKAREGAAGLSHTGNHNTDPNESTHLSSTATHARAMAQRQTEEQQRAHAAELEEAALLQHVLEMSKRSAEVDARNRRAREMIADANAFPAMEQRERASYCPPNAEETHVFRSHDTTLSPTNLASAAATHYSPHAVGVIGDGLSDADSSGYSLSRRGSRDSQSSFDSMSSQGSIQSAQFATDFLPVGWSPMGAGFRFAS